jgi:hypothetical protein
MGIHDMESKKSGWGIARSGIIPLPQQRAYVMTKIISRILKIKNNEQRVWSRLVDKIENGIKEGKPLKFIRCNSPEFDLSSKKIAVSTDFLGAVLWNKSIFL